MTVTFSVTTDTNKSFGMTEMSFILNDKKRALWRKVNRLEFL